MTVTSLLLPPPPPSSSSSLPDQEESNNNNNNRKKIIVNGHRMGRRKQHCPQKTGLGAEGERSHDLCKHTHILYYCSHDERVYAARVWTQ